MCLIFFADLLSLHPGLANHECNCDDILSPAAQEIIEPVKGINNHLKISPMNLSQALKAPKTDHV